MYQYLGQDRGCSRGLGSTGGIEGMGRQAGDSSAQAAANIVEGALTRGPCPREGVPSRAGHKDTRGPK